MFLIRLGNRATLVPRHAQRPAAAVPVLPLRHCRALPIASLTPLQGVRT